VKVFRKESLETWDQSRALNIKEELNPNPM
jgi:hypothetical protein